ncbi:lysophospholipid acyltransferase family protein [Alcanivorax sp.]|jgi:1-acyl-sn-glycerol-3-phosphate acyltransferase|uniref:lysophospholipid acyltransferase family protein n=1 Tax=Alcanivorax sp. TaxID=1872427 RepID=UPI0032D957FD
MPDSNKEFAVPSLRTSRLLSLCHRLYFNPVFLGLESMDLSRPALWVGNHTLFAMLDIPLLSHALRERGVMLRSLGDRGHFRVPVWGGLLQRGGMVLGSRENCAALMQAGEHILVFPGGAREVWRRKGEAYQLIWKKRTGFVRMAMEHGYDIIPFASLGPDEAFDILADANDVQASRAWKWLNKSLPLEDMTRGGEGIPPLVKGLGPTLVPRPQRQYFAFGERIETIGLAGKVDDEDVVWALRERVAESVGSQLESLKAYRADHRPSGWSRLRRRLAPVSVNVLGKSGKGKAS